MSSRNLASNYERGCVSGLFDDDSKAERAIDSLKTAGFSRDHISIATAGKEDRKNDFWDKVNDMLGKEDHAEASATLKDSLLQCGMDDSTAQYFDDSLETGKVLITVVADSVGVVKAREIMQAAGADLGEAAIGRPIAREPVHRERTETVRPIQLRGEVLRAVKERIPSGETRLRKEVVTENKHLEVPVEKENLVIERRPGSGQPTGPVGAESKDVRVPVSEERVRVEKTPVVNEEVRVRKEPIVETKKVDAELKHEELRTEKGEPKPIREDKDKAA